MDRGTWWATVHGVAKSWTQLSDLIFTFHNFNFIAAFRLEEARELLSQVYKSKEWELTDEMIQTRHEQIFRIYLLFK